MFYTDASVSSQYINNVRSIQQGRANEENKPRSEINETLHSSRSETLSGSSRTTKDGPSTSAENPDEQIPEVRVPNPVLGYRGERTRTGQKNYFVHISKNNRMGVKVIRYVCRAYFSLPTQFFQRCILNTSAVTEFSKIAKKVSGVSIVGGRLDKCGGILDNVNKSVIERVNKFKKYRDGTLFIVL